MYQFYLLCIGELKPDYVSSNIQEYLTDKYGRPVNWSHCAIEVVGPNVRPDERVWDATGRGFEPGTMEKALDDGLAVARHRIRLPVKDAGEAMGWLRGKRGAGYSNLQYILFAPCPAWLRKFLHWILPTALLKMFKNGRRRVVCSEVIGWFMRDNHPTAHQDPRLGEEEMDRFDPFLAPSVAFLWSPDFTPQEFDRLFTVPASGE